tara:strand:+ start:720 stop:1613 length:894 start_codon:yes stop_codon:yes gene_type:complete
VFEQSKNFNKLVGFSALSIAGSAAFFSVYGLSKLFAGAEAAVVIMAGSLEFGKLVAASFLYRYWNKINVGHKIYMTTATIILILITSAGIFGFLSNAYQGATVGFEKESTALIYKEDRLDQLVEDKKFLKEELESAISELPDNYRTAKRKLREEYQPKINKINEDIINLKSEVGDLKVKLIETGVEVGPAIYLARVFDTDIDTVVKFFIFVLIFVFDPMAVIFVVSYNVTLLEGAGKNNLSPKKKHKKNFITKEEFKKNVSETIKNDDRFSPSNISIDNETGKKTDLPPPKGAFVRK